MRGICQTSANCLDSRSVSRAAQTVTMLTWTPPSSHSTPAPATTTTRSPGRVQPSRRTSDRPPARIAAVTCPAGTSTLCTPRTSFRRRATAGSVVSVTMGHGGRNLASAAAVRPVRDRTSIAGERTSSAASTADAQIVCVKGHREERCALG